MTKPKSPQESFRVQPLIASMVGYVIIVAFMLVLSGLGLGYVVARNATKTIVRILGTLSVSILVAFSLFFPTLLLGWALAALR